MRVVLGILGFELFSVGFEQPGEYQHAALSGLFQLEQEEQEQQEYEPPFGFSQG